MTNETIPSPYGDGPPYPQSTDRAEVAVFDPTTGYIKQISRCTIVDIEKMHLGMPGLDYLECTGMNIHPETHVVDLVTRTFVPRTDPTPGQISLKESELRTAAKVGSFQSSATGQTLIYATDDPEEFKMLTIAAIVGGEVAGVDHTPKQAQKVLSDYADLKKTKGGKLKTALGTLKSAKTRKAIDDLSIS
jgi:hypothetical protein